METENTAERAEARLESTAAIKCLRLFEKQIVRWLNGRANTIAHETFTSGLFFNFPPGIFSLHKTYLKSNHSWGADCAGRHATRALAACSQNGTISGAPAPPRLHAIAITGSRFNRKTTVFWNRVSKLLRVVPDRGRDRSCRGLLQTTIRCG